MQLSRLEKKKNMRKLRYVFNAQRLPRAPRRPIAQAISSSLARSTLAPHRSTPTRSPGAGL